MQNKSLYCTAAIIFRSVFTESDAISLQVPFDYLSTLQENT